MHPALAAAWSEQGPGRDAAAGSRAGSGITRQLRSPRPAPRVASTTSTAQTLLQEPTPSTNKPIGIPSPLPQSRHGSAMAGKHNGIRPTRASPGIAVSNPRSGRLFFSLGLPERGLANQPPARRQGHLRRSFPLALRGVLSQPSRIGNTSATIAILRPRTRFFSRVFWMPIQRTPYFMTEWGLKIACGLIRCKTNAGMMHVEDD